jgi:hypothetical protein
LSCESNKVPFLQYDIIEQKTLDFRKQVECDSQICPIEKIVEFKLGLDIVPIPNLRSISDTWAILSVDKSTIFVDEYCLDSIYNKYRFTLAHETGHYVLHHEIFKELKIDNVTQWKSVVADYLSDRDYNSVEMQADLFASLLLIPTKYLQPEFERYTDSIIQEMQEDEMLKYVSKFEIYDFSLKVLCGRLAPLFEVAEQAMERRLHHGKLKSKFKSKVFKAKKDMQQL